MSIQGLDRLNRKFKRLPVVAREMIAKAMEESAQEIVALAQSLVAVESGDLRDSIGWTWGDAPKGSLVLGEVGGGNAQGNLRITIFAGNSEAFYARWVEFGTSPHVNGGKFAGSDNPGAPAQPFFFPSWRAGRKRAKSRVTRAISKSAKIVAAGG